MGIIWPWLALYVSRKIRVVNCRVSVHEDVIPTREKLLKRDEGKVRPMVRIPSVPVSLFIE
jgi:hypothetical protein